MRITICHPDKPHVAHGLCNACYKKKCFQDPAVKAKRYKANSAWVKRNRVYINKKERERRTIWRKEFRILFHELKSKPCLDCQKKFPPVCMDFDHVRGEKIDNIGSMVIACTKETTILNEIEKCELVCANCHRIRTETRRTASLIP